MHYSIDCYVAKGLPVHRPFMDIMIAEKNFSWGSTAQQLLSREKSPRTSYGENLCCLRHSVTQLLALVHILSRCYTPVSYPECCHQMTTAIFRTIWLPNSSAWALFCGSYFFSSIHIQVLNILSGCCSTNASYANNTILRKYCGNNHTCTSSWYQATSFLPPGLDTGVRLPPEYNASANQWEVSYLSEEFPSLSTLLDYLPKSPTNWTSIYM